jgi:outer membrane protein assembly factor BamB
VVFTAPDGAGIYSLKLRDGSLVWKADRADDLYLACVSGGRAVLVGKRSCRALSLANGKELWRVDSGQPAGMGIASGGVYYLPLKAGTRSGRPEVCALDLGTGTITSRSPWPGNEAPSNLLFYEGLVLSQGFTTVTCSTRAEPGTGGAGPKKEPPFPEDR